MIEYVLPSCVETYEDRGNGNVVFDPKPLPPQTWEQKWVRLWEDVAMYEFFKKPKLSKRKKK